MDEGLVLLKKSGCHENIIEHCQTVAKLSKKFAFDIIECSKRKENTINIDMDSVVMGALLHDIGRSRTHGIDHAVVGAKIAIENGLDIKIVNIIERHIGAGIPGEEAVRLGLPEKDYLPVTIEEKIVANADNLVSDSKVITIEEKVTDLKAKKVNEIIIQRIIELNTEISSWTH